MIPHLYSTKYTLLIFCILSKKSTKHVGCTLHFAEHSFLLFLVCNSSSVNSNITWTEVCYCGAQRHKISVCPLNLCRLASKVDFETELVKSAGTVITLSVEYLILLDCTHLTVVSPTDISSSCLLYTSPSPRDGLLSRMPSSA